MFKEKSNWQDDKKPQGVLDRVNIIQKQQKEGLTWIIWITMEIRIAKKKK